MLIVTHKIARGDFALAILRLLPLVTSSALVGVLMDLGWKVVSG